MIEYGNMKILIKILLYSVRHPIQIHRESLRFSYILTGNVVVSHNTIQCRTNTDGHYTALLLFVSQVS